MNINVNIDRLILRGIPLTPPERRALHGSVERELSRLFETGGESLTGVSNQHVARVAAGQVQLGSQNNPQQLGRQIAANIYGGIGQ